ncbi:hypothetical protein FXO37_06402 [Capsicum annuum]|nr:hypothetical protein FXO37_06402 [Capsicum annuum]
MAMPSKCRATTRTFCTKGYHHMQRIGRPYTSSAHLLEFGIVGNFQHPGYQLEIETWRLKPWWIPGRDRGSPGVARGSVDLGSLTDSIPFTSISFLNRVYGLVQAVNGLLVLFLNLIQPYGKIGHLHRHSIEHLFNLLHLVGHDSHRAQDSPLRIATGPGSGSGELVIEVKRDVEVDTVAYHLSVLKDMFPNGMNVLSLFSGIGGAEVALHRLGIRLNNVVSVEISEVNRNIVRSWWEQTNQRGNLIDFDDVQQLNGDRLEQLIDSFGGFDLLIGGSPCNNLADGSFVATYELSIATEKSFVDTDYSPVAIVPEVDFNRCVICCNSSSQSTQSSNRQDDETGFYKGMSFKNKKELSTSLFIAFLKKDFRVKKVINSSKVFSFRCANSTCEWWLSSERLVINVYQKYHICDSKHIMGQNPHDTADVLGQYFQNRFSNGKGPSTSDMANQLLTELGVTVSKYLKNEFNFLHFSYFDCCTRSIVNRQQQGPPQPANLLELPCSHGGQLPMEFINLPLKFPHGVAQNSNVPKKISHI